MAEPTPTGQGTVPAKRTTAATSGAITGAGVVLLVQYHFGLDMPANVAVIWSGVASAILAYAGSKLGH